MDSSDDLDLQRLAAGIGVTIRTHRAERGLSLGDMARASGLSRTILSRIESGRGTPRSRRSLEPGELALLRYAV